MNNKDFLDDVKQTRKNIRIVTEMYSMREIGKRSKVHYSNISRFLSGKSISLENYLKLRRWIENGAC